MKAVAGLALAVMLFLLAGTIVTTVAGFAAGDLTVGRDLWPIALMLVVIGGVAWVSWSYLRRSR